MPTARYTGGGTYRVGGHSFAPGDEKDVGDGLAEYLDSLEEFDVLMGSDAGICGTELSEGGTCDRPADECPYHGEEEA